MEKRNTRTYKIKDKPYQRAKKLAKGKLSTMIEEWVVAYGNGAEIIPFIKEYGEITKFKSSINNTKSK